MGKKSGSDIMLTEIKQKSQEEMTRSLRVLSHNLAKIRTGRATPDILSHINIEYHGNMISISQIASITVLDAKTLSISPWERGVSVKIEKEIIKANLGLNPVNLGDILRIQIPDLSTERRKAMVKQVKLEAEKTKIAIRGIRRNINIKIKRFVKEKNISEDQAKKDEADIQNLTNSMITKIDIITKEKEKELMAI